MNQIWKLYNIHILQQMKEISLIYTILCDKKWNEMNLPQKWLCELYLWSNTVCFFTVRTSVFLQCMFTIDEISQVDTIIRMHGEIYPDFFFFKCLTIMSHPQQKCKENWSRERKSSKKKLQPKKREIIQKC